MWGAAAQIGNGTVQKIAEKLFFFRGKAAYQLLFDIQNGLVDLLLALDTLGQNIDPLAAAVMFIRAQLHKALLFHPGKQSRYGRMA